MGVAVAEVVVVVWQGRRVTWRKRGSAREPYGVERPSPNIADIAGRREPSWAAEDDGLPIEGRPP